MSIRLTKIEDWTLGTHGFEDSVPRVLDLELAKKLGFGRTRDIRKLIERLEKSGELPGVFRRATVARQELSGNVVENSVTEFWLTMEEALFVTAKSDTAQANQILKAVIRVFLAARAEHERRLRAESGYIVTRLLSEKACQWDLMWPAEFVHAICKLHGETWTGGAQPVSLASTYAKIYSTLFGELAYRKLKDELNPDPHWGTNHHQWLTPEAREMLRGEIPKITLLAKQARSKEEFWARFDHEYSGQLLQLDFFVARQLKKPKGDPEAAE